MQGQQPNCSPAEHACRSSAAPVIAVLVLTALGAVACGGGTGSGAAGTPSGTTTPVAPGAAADDLVLQYPGPQVFTAGVNNSSDAPYLSYSDSNNHATVSPPLPSGLAVNPETGVISGVASTFAPAATYTVSVKNELAGSTSATVVLEVNGGPLFYSSPAILAPGMAMTPLRPRGGENLSGYSIAPPLPDGLTLDPASGVISGMPTVAQPATYYVITGNEPLLAIKFGLTLLVSDANGSNAAPASSASTQKCAYSGGFVGTYAGDAQRKDEGLIAIAFTPDGNAHARVLELPAGTVENSDGLTGLSPALDGSFSFQLTGSVTAQISGHFAGSDQISGTYESDGVSRAFTATRLGASASAQVRYTGGFSSSGPYPVDLGVLEQTDAKGSGVGYLFGAVTPQYRLTNQQIAVNGTFTDDTFTYTIADDDVSGVSKITDGGLNFGDPYDGEFFAQTVGCQLN